MKSGRKSQGIPAMSKLSLMENFVYSFDVFDTCLLRSCGFPSAVFQLTARALPEVLPPQAITWSDEDFVIERVRAERLARIETSSEEISLRDIWLRLCISLGVDFCDSLPAIELSCERNVLCPNPELLIKIRSLREKALQTCA